MDVGACEAAWTAGHNRLSGLEGDGNMRNGWLNQPVAQHAHQRCGVAYLLFAFSTNTCDVRRGLVLWGVTWTGCPLPLCPRYQALLPPSRPYIQENMLR